MTFPSLLVAHVLAAPFQPGDVFVGLTDGTYQRLSESGAFQEVLDTGYGGNVTGCAFDAAGDLYVTHYDFDRLIRFRAAAPHTVLFDVSDDGPPATSPDTQCESIVFDASGTFLVGRGDSAGVEVHRYDAQGGFLVEYQVPGDVRGSDWLDLASDQCTLFYTSEGRRILRYDVCTDRPLADFAVLAPAAGSALYAFRLLPPGDGSGGLVIADRADIKRLDGTGRVVQTYDAPGEDRWFALNLAPDGASFWSAGYLGGNLTRFDLATGALILGPIALGATNGICVYGEPTAAVCDPVPPPVVLLKGVRRANDADFVWQQASDPATTSYNVWKVITGDKRLIPKANADEAAVDPAIRPVCLVVPVASPTCTDPDAVAPPPPLLFYQVRGACPNQVEGPE